MILGISEDFRAICVIQNMYLSVLMYIHMTSFNHYLPINQRFIGIQYAQLGTVNAGEIE